MYMFQCTQHVSDLCIQSRVVLQFLMKIFFRHLIAIFSDVFQFFDVMLDLRNHFSCVFGNRRVLLQRRALLVLMFLAFTNIHTHTHTEFSTSNHENKPFHIAAFIKNLQSLPSKHLQQWLLVPPR